MFGVRSASGWLRRDKRSMSDVRWKFPASHFDMNFLHALHSLRGPARKEICNARRASHSQDCGQIFLAESGIQLELASREMKQAAEVEIMNPRGQRRAHNRQIETMRRAVDHHGMTF